MSFQTVEASTDASAPDDTVFSLIDRHTTVDGTLSTSYDLRVDGKVMGDLQCAGTLYVSDGASVDATMSVGAIVVAGSVAGVIRCLGRFEIQSTGNVRAEVATGSLVIVEGAIFEGKIRMEAPAEPYLEAAGEPLDAESSADQPYSFLRRFSPPDAEGDVDDSDLPAAPDDDQST